MTWVRVAIALPLGLVFGRLLAVAIRRVPAAGSGVAAAPRSLVEPAVAASFVAAAASFDRLWVAAMMAPFLGLLASVAVIDIRHRVIPNRLIYPALVAFPAPIVVGAIAGWGMDVLDAVIGFLAYGGAILVVALVSPRGMGMGDVKLAALIGLVVGAIDLPSVAVAAGMGILLGGFAAIGALVTGKGRKSTLPYGPFLAAGAAIAVFFGRELADVYIRALT